MNDLIRGLIILQKYDPNAELCARHDELLVATTAFKIGKSRHTMTEADEKELLAISGWHWASAEDCWGFFT